MRLRADDAVALVALALMLGALVLDHLGLLEDDER